jgi:anti-sigma factor RsiW
MDCGRVRELLEDELDGALSPDDALALEEHIHACPACARERRILTEIDAALMEAPRPSAPRWLPKAVAGELARESVVERRVEPIAIGVVVAAGVASTIVAVVRAAGPGAAGPLERTTSHAAQGLGSFMESLMTMPGVPTSWSENPGIVGFGWGLSIALVAFLAVSVYRFSHKLSPEWR